MSATMTEAVTVMEERPSYLTVTKEMPRNESTTEEIPKFTASGEIIKDAKHYHELKDRNLLYTDYTLLKRVTAEQGLLNGVGLAAVLLQIAHPGVGRGVGLHSDFDERVVERTQNTAMYVFSTIHGTPEERAAIRKFVTRKHGKVYDNKDKNKRTYSALDPKLQLWVAATGFGTAMIAREVFGMPLSPEDQEQVLQEFSTVGTGLQVPLEMWPRTVQDFWVYWDHIIQNELEMTEPCQNVATKLFNPTKNPHLPSTMRRLSYILSPIRVASAAEILERVHPRTRTMFGLELGWKENMINTTVSYMTWALSPLSPSWLPQYIADYYMNMLRKQMAERKIF
jgi:uncharacterized protein (DUF2236 family)